MTNEQFDKKIENSRFIRVDEYINSKTPIKFECKKCGKILKTEPKKFNKLNCKCEKNLKIYEKSLEEKNIKLIGTYFNCRSKVLHLCKTCNNEFITSPKILKNSIYGCPFCAGTKISEKDYSNRLPSDIKLIGSYINAYTKIEHQCLICNNIWISSPGNILYNNCGCPVCSSSKGERAIKNYLNDNYISYIKEYSVKINNIDYRFDFYLPQSNIFVEFDGIQHYKPVDYFGGKKAFLTNEINDKIKNKWCLDNNFILIRIPYYIKNILEFLANNLPKIPILF